MEPSNTDDYPLSSLRDHTRVLQVAHDDYGFGRIFFSRRCDTVMLGDILIYPQFRGQGHGKRLLKKLLSTARHSGARSAWLWTTNDNIAAISLYTSAGFRLRNMPARERVVRQAYPWIKPSRGLVFLSRTL